MKRQYELMVIVKTTFPYDDEKKRSDLLEKLVGETATIVEHTLLGKKGLAYPIQKQGEGAYILATVEGTIQVGDIEKQVRLGEDVLRYLLTVKKEEKTS